MTISKKFKKVAFSLLAGAMILPTTPVFAAERNKEQDAFIKDGLNHYISLCDDRIGYKEIDAKELSNLKEIKGSCSYLKIKGDIPDSFKIDLVDSILVIEGDVGLDANISAGVILVRGSLLDGASAQAYNSIWITKDLGKGAEILGEYKVQFDGAADNGASAKSIFEKVKYDETKPHGHNVKIIDELAVEKGPGCPDEDELGTSTVSPNEFNLKL